MHHIYHTRGFILSSKNIGEANKMFAIYTRELGLVHAAAQGVRLSKSKLRFSLQDFSLIDVDLVRGRDLWRVTSAKIENSFPFVRINRSSILLLSRFTKLIERLCDGEEANYYIFDLLVNSLKFLDKGNIDQETTEALELHFVLGVLNSLGYIGGSGVLEPYLKQSFDQIEREKILKDRSVIISFINKAFAESQL